MLNYVNKSSAANTSSSVTVSFLSLLTSISTSNDVTGFNNSEAVLEIFPD